MAEQTYQHMTGALAVSRPCPLIVCQLQRGAPLRHAYVNKPTNSFVTQQHTQLNIPAVQRESRVGQKNLALVSSRRRGDDGSGSKAHNVQQHASPRVIHNHTPAIYVVKLSDKFVHCACVFTALKCRGADNSGDGLGAYRTYLGVNHRNRMLATVHFVPRCTCVLRPLRITVMTVLMTPELVEAADWTTKSVALNSSRLMPDKVT